DRLAEAAVVSLAGDISFEGVTVNYLDGLPPVTGVDGTADYDLQTFRIATRGGQVGDLAVPESTIVISELDRGGPEPIDIDVVVSGPVRSTLELLDLPRLGYPSRIGLAPSAIAGQMAARLHF